MNLEALAAAEPIICECIFCFLEIATDGVTVYIDTVPILSLCHACGNASALLGNDYGTLYNSMYMSI